LKSFLSTEKDPELTKQLVMISEQLSPIMVELFLTHYAQIVDQIDNLEVYLQGQLKQPLEMDTLMNIRGNLLSSANELITTLATEIEKKPANNERIQLVLQRIKQINRDTVLFTQTYKELIKQPNVTIESLAETEITSITNDQITEDNLSEMTNLFQRSREQYEDPSIIQKDLTHFENRVTAKDQKSRVYQMRHKNNLIAFVRFDKTPSGGVHAASLNNTPDAKNAGIGMDFLAETLIREAKNQPIESEVALTPFLIDTYVNRMGFILRGIEIDKEDGETLFDMVIDNRLSDTIRDKAPEQTKIIELDLPKEQERVQTEINELFKRGFIVREVKKDEQSPSKLTFIFDQYNLAA